MMMEDDGKRSGKKKSKNFVLKSVGDGLGTLVGVPIGQKKKSDRSYDQKNVIK